MSKPQAASATTTHSLVSMKQVLIDSVAFDEGAR